MQANPDDQLTRHNKSGGLPIRALVLGAAALAVLAALFWPRQNDAPPEAETVATPDTAAAPAALPPAEDIPRPAAPAQPVEAEAPAESPAEPESEPLPPLEESDPVLRDSLQEVGATSGLFEPLQEKENLVSTLGALVDGSSRGVIMRKLLPVEAPEAPFPVMQTDDGLTIMDPSGYQRYNPYALAIAGLDTEAMAAQFHRLRPLFEAGWQQLGLAPEDFDNAVIRTLDRILATPELEGPVALEQEAVMYTYADPELEALTPLQKQLLRMGPANLRLIKAQARELREALLGANSQT
jgi:hypothetical protein